MTKQIKDLKKGEYFTLSDRENPPENMVYIRGDYDRSVKKYECCKFSDVNATRFFNGSKVVFVEFTF